MTTAHGQTEPVQHVLDRLLAHGDPSIWERRSCGYGSKGPREYDWTPVAVTVSGQDPAPELPTSC